MLRTKLITSLISPLVLFYCPTSARRCRFMQPVIWKQGHWLSEFGRFKLLMNHLAITTGSGRAKADFFPFACILNLVIVFSLLMVCYSAQAHHVLGRPSYSLGSESNTPPSAQVETQIGDYYVTYMVFPAFPEPNQPGRVNLYISRIDNGETFQGRVTFRIIDDGWFNSRQELLGIQEVDDNVYRQGFEFNEDGDYIIRAEFAPDDELYKIDFPLQIGEKSLLGPIGIGVAVILIMLFGVNIMQRKKLVTARIKSAHKASSDLTQGDGGA